MKQSSADDRFITDKRSLRVLESLNGNKDYEKK